VTSSHFASTGSAPDQDDSEAPTSEEVQTAFAAAGLSVSVEERGLSLTVSADGEMLIGIFVGVQLPEFARLMVDDAYVGIKSVLQRFRRRGAVRYIIYAGESGVDARIDLDLPPEAYMKLQSKLPNAPSGRIIFNREVGRWQDSRQVN
jgi:hypothetical protein